jgi:hypothetical protein
MHRTTTPRVPLSTQFRGLILYLRPHNVMGEFLRKSGVGLLPGCSFSRRAMTRRNAVDVAPTPSSTGRCSRMGAKLKDPQRSIEAFYAFVGRGEQGLRPGEVIHSNESWRANNYTVRIPEHDDCSCRYCPDRAKGYPGGARSQMSDDERESSWGATAGLSRASPFVPVPDNRVQVYGHQRESDS